MSEAPLELQLATAREELRSVYRERAHLLAFLSAMTPGALAYTDPDTPEWPVLTIDGGPGDQMSWHIAPDDLDLFAHMPADAPAIAWDGHSTEEKYERLRTMTAFMVELRDAGLFAAMGGLFAGVAEDEGGQDASSGPMPTDDSPSARAYRGELPPFFPAPQEPEPVQETLLAPQAPAEGPQEPSEPTPAPKRRGRPRKTAQTAPEAPETPKEG